MYWKYRVLDSDIKINQKKIEKFINDYQFYSNKGIDEIIEDQGEKEFKEMMTAFSDLVK